MLESHKLLSNFNESLKAARSLYSAIPISWIHYYCTNPKQDFLFWGGGLLVFYYSFPVTDSCKKVFALTLEANYSSCLHRCKRLKEMFNDFHYILNLSDCTCVLLSKFPHCAFFTLKD